MAKPATKAADGKRIATAEDFAAQEYEAWPADTLAKGPISSLAKWLKRAEQDFPTVRVALEVMKRDHHGNAEVAKRAGADQEGTEALQAFIESMYDVAQRYSQLVTMLEAAHARALAGMARHLTEKGEIKPSRKPKPNPKPGR